MAIFLLLLYPYVLSQFYRAFLAIVAGDLARDVGLNAADLGTISAGWFAAFALAQFPVGLALDRYGPRRTICGFMVLAVLGAAGFALSVNFLTAFVSMALIGIGCAPLLMASLYIFARTAKPERFAMLSSMMIGLGSIGNLLGATPLALAVSLFGWRQSMLGIAAITALSVILIFVFLKDPPMSDRDRGNSGTGLRGFVDVLRLPAMWYILPIAFASYAVLIATRSLWIAPYFGEVHGFDVTQTGNAAFAMALAMSIGALAYGPAERLIGDAKRTVLLGNVLTCIAFAALAMLGPTSAAASVVLLTVIGGIGMTYGILMAHARHFFSAELLGRGVTLVNFSFIAGAGLVQWLSGGFVQAQVDAGLPAAQTYSALFIAFTGFLTLATLIYALAPARPVEKP